MKRAGFVCATVVVLAASCSGTSNEAPPSPSTPRQISSLIDFKSDPIGPGAKETGDVPEDVDQLPFSLILAKGDQNDGIQKVWLRTDIEPAIAIRFESGVTLFERVAEPVDWPTSEFYAQLSAGVTGSSTMSIDDAPAMVIQSTEILGNPSSVDLILQGVHISIIGNVGQDAQELVALAEAFKESGAGDPVGVS